MPSDPVHQTTRYRAANDPADTSGTARSVFVRAVVLLGLLTEEQAERAIDESVAAGDLVEVPRG